MTTTVTGKNQITIPADLAREMEIGPGSRLEWSRGEGSSLNVRILPSRAELAKRLAGRGKSYLRPGSDPVRDLIDERAAEERGEGLE